MQLLYLGWIVKIKVRVINATDKYSQTQSTDIKYECCILIWDNSQLCPVESRGGIRHVYFLTAGLGLRSFIILELPFQKFRAGILTDIQSCFRNSSLKSA